MSNEVICRSVETEQLKLGRAVKYCAQIRGLCPCRDLSETSRGLVVRTENGSLLTTGKVWQSVVKPKLKIEVDEEFLHIE